MKRAKPNEVVSSSNADESSSDSDSSSDSEDDADLSVKLGKRKMGGGAIDFEALSRHGYRGGLSVLKVPPPKVDDKDRDWSWSNGKEKAGGEETEESYEERQRTKAALMEGEKLVNVKTRKDIEKEYEKEREKRSFAQKEKRKRDLGQASRGKNYVEEEKRLLRENGVYSGFDS